MEAEAENDVEEASEISREAFFEFIEVAERRFETMMAEAYAGLSKLEAVRRDVFRAEFDGLRVRFFETEEATLYQTEVKEPVGFGRKPC